MKEYHTERPEEGTCFEETPSIQPQNQIRANRTGHKLSWDTKVSQVRLVDSLTKAQVSEKGASEQNSVLPVFYNCCVITIQ